MISNNSSIVKLRPIEGKDLPTVQAWFNMKPYQGYEDELKEWSMDHVSQWFHDMQHHHTREWYFVQDEQYNAIGLAGLNNINWITRKSNIQFNIYQKGGVDAKYAPELMKIMLKYCFNHLNLNKIYCSIPEVDENKIQFLSSSGFTIEGTARDHHFWNGRYVDTMHLGMLRKDYIVLQNLDAPTSGKLNIQKGPKEE